MYSPVAVAVWYCPVSDIAIALQFLEYVVFAVQVDP